MIDLIRLPWQGNVSVLLQRGGISAVSSYVLLPGPCIKERNRPVSLCGRGADRLDLSRGISVLDTQTRIVDETSRLLGSHNGW